MAVVNLRSTLDMEAMQQRVDAAEDRYLDGVSDIVTERLEAYVLRAGGCSSCHTSDHKEEETE